ncbi:MAG: calcium/sodium antiporter [Parvularculaceae bacterium]
MNDWLMIGAGLVVLAVGAEVLIRGATEIARRLGLSELLIGLTLVGFGTSTPELVSSIEAALKGSAGIAVGNVVGSNIVNILLILGLSAVIAPILVEPKSFRRDSIAVVGATLLAIGVSMTTGFTRLAGVIFLAGLLAYIALAYLTERRAPDHPETARHEAAGARLPGGPKSIFVDLAMAVVGLAILMVGARFLVNGSISVAASMGVSETLIGLTIVAVGTSLPELVTSLLAAMRGKSALALGNVVGSNIYNILGILGATALIHPLSAPPQIVRFDNWVMLAATLVMVYFARSGGRITRLEGGVMMLAYGVYVLWLALNAGA